LHHGRMRALALALFSAVFAEQVSFSKPTITRELIDEYAHLVDIAYCAPYIYAPFQCLSRCSEFNLTLISTFATPSDIQGYIACDSDRMVVAFRGSQSWRNIITDIQTEPLNVTTVCADCAVHTGFWAIWNETAAVVDPLLRTHLRPHQRLVIAGHSLGGAMTTLAALQWKEFRPLAVSFGQPRTVNHNFSDYLRQHVRDYYRITTPRDPIPKIPVQSMGYRHHGQEIFIDGEHMRWCNGDEDETCCGAGLVLPGEVLLAHLHYGGHGMGVCAPKFEDRSLQMMFDK